MLYFLEVWKVVVDGYQPKRAVLVDTQARLDVVTRKSLSRLFAQRLNDWSIAIVCK